MDVLATTREEMEDIVAKKRIMIALLKAVQSAADRVHEIGEEVWVYREKKKAWEGQMLITQVVDKIVSVHDIEDDYLLRMRQYLKMLPRGHAR